MENQIREGDFKEIAARVLPSVAISKSASGSRVWCISLHYGTHLHRSLPDLATGGFQFRPSGFE
jgi:hypothetical protein